MTIILLSNYFNHHQKPICDVFHRITYGNFTFVATEKVSEWRKKLGYQELTAPYVIECNEDSKDEIEHMLFNADVVITDGEHLNLTKRRYDAGKITFRCAERLFKSKLRYLKMPVHAIKAWKTRRMYMLCCSAFTAHDFNLMGFYKNRSFKWGYFPFNRFYPDNQEIVNAKERNSILWVGRLIDWKHPEAPIEVAKMLRDRNREFTMNIIGTGAMEDELLRMIKSYDLSDSVHMLGPKSPDEVRSYMENSEIFLFTSDEGEGWGAVLNESMNSGCAVVASNKIGSAPFLIENGVNGFLFESENWDDLSMLVEKLVLDKSLRIKTSLSAIDTINNKWCAEQAAKNFIQLVECLRDGKDCSIIHGPCSPTN